MSLVLAYLGIITVLIIALNAQFIGKFLGVMDDPGREGHKSHALPTPLVGALMLGSLSGFMLFNQFFFAASSRMVGISICTILAAFLGMVDDKLQLSWLIRLIAIAAISTLLVVWVPELRLVELVWSFGATSKLGSIGGAAFTVLCLMTIVISFNMMDGFNGGVIGISLVLFVVMALLATNPHRQAICLFLASALGIMFIYNIKGEFFLGDGGAYGLGILVGAVAILTYSLEAAMPVYADTILVWLAVPALDCLRVVITRKTAKASPFHSSRDHLHHILIKVIGSVKTLIVYCIVFIGFSSLTFVSGHYTSIVFLGEVLCLVLLLRWAKKAPERPGVSS